MADENIIYVIRYCTRCYKTVTPAEKYCFGCGGEDFNKILPLQENSNLPGLNDCLRAPDGYGG